MEEEIRERPLSPQEAYRLEIEKQHKQRRKKLFGFMIGITVIAFSFVGIFGCVKAGIEYFKDKKAEKEEAEFQIYNSYLLPVAAVDPKSFDDVTGADMRELVEMAVWSVIGAELDPNDYDYSSGALAIPASQVEAEFVRHFGKDITISHCTVTGFGYEFSYNEDDNVYYIPLTAIEPLYTPRVTAVETKGDTKIITLGLVNAVAWEQDSVSGERVPTEPDKYMTVTLRQSGDDIYIGSIRTEFRPESSIVEVFTNEDKNNVPTQENTSSSGETDTSEEASS